MEPNLANIVYLITKGTRSQEPKDILAAQTMLNTLMSQVEKTVGRRKIKQLLFSVSTAKK